MGRKIPGFAAAIVGALGTPVWLFGTVALVLSTVVAVQGAEWRAVLLEKSAVLFSHPHDLVLSPDRRLLYVADVGNNTVQVLDPKTLRIVGKIGAADLDSPHDVFFDDKGRLLVADTGNDRVVIYEVRGTEGKMVGELGGDAFASPEGVVQAADGRIYVTNAGGHNVVIYSGPNLVGSFGSGGTGQGNYVRPHDIAVAGAGRLLVTDPGNNRIHLVDLQGRLAGMLGPPRFAFNEPKYIALDERGWLYVADQHNNKIKIYDLDFRQVALIPSSSGGRAHRLNWPEGVEAHDNRIWVSDTYNNVILLYELRELR
ncbi:MAG: NHL repeat-containing protein [SAR324 cluster bacterium]|nr:NHL repeat-containing protein [SAR324 cluster bacterium]